MSDLVTINIENFIASVRLNRADKYNALSVDMIKAIVAAGEKVAADKSIRVVVLSGEGRGFCAGLDFSSFSTMGSGIKTEDIELFARKEGTPANYAQQVGYVWKQVPVPVIAAIHGVAYGGGLQLALGADIRLASPGARFSVLEIKWGLVPDMSGTQTLRDLVGLDVAKELTFTGKVISADEADKIGLVTRVCEDPLAEANEMAAVIAAKSPDAIVAGKKLMESTWHGTSEEGLLREEEIQKTLIGTPNQIEAVMSNFEKRDPNYRERK